MLVTAEEQAICVADEKLSRMGCVTFQSTESRTSGEVGVEIGIGIKEPYQFATGYNWTARICRRIGALIRANISPEAGGMTDKNRLRARFQGAL